MDFDHRFDREEFHQHLQDHGLLEMVGNFDELLTRTTENTRRGKEFSFKPYHLSVGRMHANGDFMETFSDDIEKEGPDPLFPAGPKLRSSFWIRFDESEAVRSC